MLFLITAHHQSEEVNLLVIQPMCFLFHVPILTKRKKTKQNKELHSVALPSLHAASISADLASPKCQQMF